MPTQMPSMAFTIVANGKLREIITDSFVSKLVPPVQIKAINKIKVKALWDTGAMISAITDSTVKALGLIPDGGTNVVYGGNIVYENLYSVLIYLPNHVVFPARVTQCRDKTNFELIIGMDIITGGDFAITNKNKKTTVSYRVPSSVEIDFRKEIKQETSPEIPAPKAPEKKTILAPMRNGKVNGNLPCPCGSGRKYKQCHGWVKPPKQKGT
jgi:hypothetical protein